MMTRFRRVAEVYAAKGDATLPEGALLVYDDGGLQCWFQPGTWHSYTYWPDRTLEVEYDAAGIGSNVMSPPLTGGARSGSNVPTA